MDAPVVAERDWLTDAPVRASLARHGIVHVGALPGSAKAAR
jgi:hypothetical protein